MPSYSSVGPIIARNARTLKNVIRIIQSTIEYDEANQAIPHSETLKTFEFSKTFNVYNCGGVDSHKKYSNDTFKGIINVFQ